MKYRQVGAMIIQGDHGSVVAVSTDNDGEGREDCSGGLVVNKGYDSGMVMCGDCGGKKIFVDVK